MSSTLAEPTPPTIEQQHRTSVIPYVMLIIITHFGLAPSVLQALQAIVPTVVEAISDVTRRKSDGCLIVDVPLPELTKVELFLDTASSEEIYDYIPVQFE